jgi:hypothetical protein
MRQHSTLAGDSFVDADWSDITTLEDRDQVAGAIILQYLAIGDGPDLLDEDRYGHYISPRHDRCFLRRLMWASLLSGGYTRDFRSPFAGDAVLLLRRTGRMARQ